MPSAYANADLDRAVADRMKETMDSFIKPSYVHLKQSTDAFTQTMAVLCTEPSTDHLIAAREDFRAVVQAWGAIEMVRFGTILADNLLERFHFYPDRRSRGLKQVQKLLAAQDSSALRLNSLRDKSVAVQGLGAAEYVLFGRGHDLLQTDAGEGAFRCAYGRTIAQNLQFMATALRDGWNSDARFIKMWRDPGPDNEAFGDGKQALAHLLSTLVHGLEEVRDVRLAAFLRSSPDKDKPKSAPLWRSSSSMPLLNADIKSLRDFYRITRMQELLGANALQADKKVHNAFARAIELSSVTRPPSILLADPQERKRLVALRKALGELTILFYREFAEPLRVAIGFFFADGD